MTDDRYGIAGQAAGEAVLRFGRDGAKLRPASDAFLLSRIARAVVDALDTHEMEVVAALAWALDWIEAEDKQPSEIFAHDDLEQFEDAKALLDRLRSGEKES